VQNSTLSSVPSSVGCKKYAKTLTLLLDQCGLNSEEILTDYHSLNNPPVLPKRQLIGVEDAKV